MVKPPPAPTRFIVPLWLLLLDLFGLVIVGLGAAQQMGRLQIIPPSWKIPDPGVVLMALGVACMLPLVFHILQVVKKARQEENEWLKTLPDDIQKKLADKIKSGK